jgi:hypothetical protein
MNEKIIIVYNYERTYKYNYQCYFLLLFIVLLFHQEYQHTFLTPLIRRWQ